SGSVSLDYSSRNVAVRRDDQTTTGLLKLSLTNVRCFSLLPDDRAVLSSLYGLSLYDTRSAKRLRVFEYPTGVNAIAPSPDNRYFLSASSDQTLRIWSPERRQHVLSLLFAGEEWIAWTPEGYYAASPGGEQFMGWHVTNGPEQMASFYPASQFRKTFYRPDV